MPMILLAVVGSSNQSNTITMMSLLWWGALTNQNHAQPLEDYRGSLQRKITMGVYRGRSPQEFTVEDHHRSLLQKITAGVYCRRSPQEFTTEDLEFTTEDHRGSLPITLTIGCP